MSRQFVAYIRVSTKQQGVSGLGLEAQKESIEAFLHVHNGRLIDTFVEIESGRKGSKDRPQLNAALSRAKQQSATLLVAKLDRLSRNVHFVSGLIESGVDFLAIDVPSASKVMLQFISVVAEYERDQISARTKAALAVAKSRGTVLGKAGRSNLTPCIEQRISQANTFALNLKDTLQAQITRGLSRRGMRDELNRIGVRSPTGKLWSLTQLQRTVSRLELA